MDVQPFDMHRVVFIDGDGEEVNAYDYLLADGNLWVPGGRYGSDTVSCAEVACLVFEIMAHCNGPDSMIVECLDGIMGSVVNSADDVAYTIAEYAELVGADPADYLDAEDFAEVAAYKAAHGID